MSEIRLDDEAALRKRFLDKCGYCMGDITMACVLEVQDQTLETAAKRLEREYCPWCGSAKIIRALKNKRVDPKRKQLLEDVVGTLTSLSGRMVMVAEYEFATAINGCIDECKKQLLPDGGEL